jgi:hypothetical protein
MQPRNHCLPRRAVPVFIASAALAVSSVVSAQGKDDLWEMTSKIDMPGMPMAVPAQVNRVCISKNHRDEDLIPRRDNCRVTESKRTGTKLTYKMECTGNEAMTMVGDLTLGSNAYDGQMRMTITKTKDTMNMALSGKRVGDCTAPAK